MLNRQWDEVLKDEYNKEYFTSLLSYLDKEYEVKKIYPEKENIFTAFKLTDYDEVKVVIIGQDPYHNYHQAHGLAFSVYPDSKIPPSLRNIYKEIESDLNIKMSKNGNLTSWAKQGVFLLNTILTVEENKPGSHKSIGWTKFTDAVIKVLNERSKPIVFILWGNEAQKKVRLITNESHVILKSCHPSPLSVFHGFYGCRHFSITNQYLRKWYEQEIDWQN